MAVEMLPPCVFSLASSIIRYRGLEFVKFMVVGTICHVLVPCPQIRPLSLPDVSFSCSSTCTASGRHLQSGQGIYLPPLKSETPPWTSKNSYERARKRDPVGEYLSKWNLPDLQKASVCRHLVSSANCRVHNSNKSILQCKL